MKNICIIRLSSMGDVILASSAIEYSGKCFPGSKIYFVTSRRYTELFKDDPRLAAVISADEGDEQFAGILNTKWDIVADLQNSPKSRLIVEKYFGGERVRRFDKLHLSRALLILFRLDTYPSVNGVIPRYIKTVDPDFAGDGSLFPAQLFFGCSNEDFRMRIFGEKGIGKKTLALMPFAAWKNKQWGLDSIAGVGRHFALNGWNVVVLGGPEDKTIGASVAESIGTNAVSAAGLLNLHDTGCFLKTCNLALGVDTGLSHLARACNVKTGIIYGPTTRHFGFYPLAGPLSAVFETGVLCRPCHAHGGEICLRITRPCMRNISVETVISGLEKLLSSDGS